MDALKVYDVKKICDARLCIMDMAAAFVRALVTVLLMGRVAVLYRYCAVLVTLFCTRGRRPARSKSHARACPHTPPVWFPTNVARNSHVNLSNLEIASLRFCGYLDALQK